jgi:hypothetical protein
MQLFRPSSDLNERTLRLTFYAMLRYVLYQNGSLDQLCGRFVRFNFHSKERTLCSEHWVSYYVPLQNPISSITYLEAVFFSVKLDFDVLYDG